MDTATTTCSAAPVVMPFTCGEKMKPRLKPVIKANDGRGGIAEWIVDKFPENYREMNYLEPFVGSGSVLLQKDPSKEEVINDLDSELMSIWWSVRDEPKLFVSKIKRIEHKESIFRKYHKKNESEYLNIAVKEFLLRHMSKSGLKKTYLPKERNLTCGDCWCDILESVPELSDRLKEVFMMNKDALSIIKSFSHSDSFIYCDPPHVGEEYDCMELNKHVELSEILKEFRGKALIIARNSALYKRLYAGWARKGVPGETGESLWMNY